MRSRYFTPEEARTQLPKVKSLMLNLRASVLAFRQVASRSGSVEESAAGKARDPSQGESLKQSIQNILGQLTRLGVQVKDVDAGLVDFPALKEGREVCLCWRLDDSGLEFWHTVEEGFKGRKPIGEVPAGDWVWFS